jgi:hypothetical protein
VLLAMAAFHYSFMGSWKKVKEPPIRSSKVLGYDMAKPKSLALGIVIAYFIYDDWRFLFEAQMDEYDLLFLYCLSNLVGVCYIVCNIVFLDRDELN